MGSEARRILQERQAMRVIEPSVRRPDRYDVEMEFDSPFSRLIEEETDVAPAPTAKKIKLKAKKRARRSTSGR